MAAAKTAKRPSAAASALLAFLGAAFFALGLAVLYAAFFEARSMDSLDHIRLGLLAGAGFYLLIHRFFGVGDFFATFTHELCHTIVCVLSGGKPTKFFASDTQGGYAHLTRTNFLVVLAPYFLPIWAVIGAAAFRLLVWVKAAPFILPYAAFFVGAAVMHHLLCLLWSCRPHQPDLKRYGMIFSYGFIVFANALILTHILIYTAKPDAPWFGFLNSLRLFAVFQIEHAWPRLSAFLS